MPIKKYFSQNLINEESIHAVIQCTQFKNLTYQLLEVPGITSGTTALKKILFFPEKNQSILIKLVPWYASTAGFVKASSELQVLLSSDFNLCPEIITINNQYYNEISANRFVTAQKYLDIDNLHSRYTYCPKEIGKCLARFHKSSKYFSKQDGLPQESVFSISHQMISIAEEEFSDKYSPSRSTLKLLTSLINECRTKIDLAKQNAEYFGYFLNKCITHGDFNYTNILCGSELQAEHMKIVDFDNLCIDSPAHDIAQALLHIASFKFQEKSTRFQGLPATIDINLANAFLDGYFLETSDNFNLLQQTLYSIPAITCELVILGFLRGDFHEHLLEDAPNNIESIVQTAQELFN